MNSERIGLVTGAAKGIGNAIAEELCSTCSKVVLLDIDPAWPRIEEDGQYLRLHCDVGDSSAVKSAFDEVVKRVGTPNVVVNNVGRGGPFHRVDEVSDAEWFSLFQVNVKSVFNIARAVLPSMKEAGFGRIVNIASVQGFTGAARSSTYVAGKHAVIGYSRAIAAEWGMHGITCNAICPGYVDTAQGVQDGLVDEHTKQVISRTPARRIASPQEVARLVSYVVGEDGSFINGSAITIDGGFSCHIGVS